MGWLRGWRVDCKVSNIALSCENGIATLAQTLISVMCDFGILCCKPLVVHVFCREHKCSREMGNHIKYETGLCLLNVSKNNFKYTNRESPFLITNYLSFSQQAVTYALKNALKVTTTSSSFYQNAY
jgi:hypothetical protein